MKLIHDLEDQGSLKDVVTQDLKEIGIKFPKHKKSKTKEEILVRIFSIYCVVVIAFECYTL